MPEASMYTWLIPAPPAKFRGRKSDVPRLSVDLAVDESWFAQGHFALLMQVYIAIICASASR